MPSVGILGAEAYVASFITEIAYQTQYNFVGVACQNIPLSLPSDNFEYVDPNVLISNSDILIADGADLRFQHYMLHALREEKTVFLLNPLSVSVSFFDELTKTATEAGAKLIPALPFRLNSGLSIAELRKSSFIFFNYQQLVPEKLTTNLIRNSLFLLYYLSRMPIRSVYHYIPMLDDCRDTFIHFSLKFENGSGAAVSLSALNQSVIPKGNLSIHNGETIIDMQVDLAPYAQPHLKLLTEYIQDDINEQLNCAVAWFLNWFEKKILTLR